MSDADYLRDLIARRRAESKVTLAVAKDAALATGKEPFEFSRLKDLCPVSAVQSTSSIQAVAEWEWRYYVAGKNLRTLEEFAKMLELSDLYDGGDMHLDEW